MKLSLGFVAILLIWLSAPAWGRPASNANRRINFEALHLDHVQDLPISTSPGSAPASGQDTVFFGGTFWNADSSRWQAIRDSVWTFDSGVGSHFDHSAEHVNPYKDPSLHAVMEGWVGIDETFSDLGDFRRLSESDFPDTICVGDMAGLGGDYSFWCGVLPGEADELCYATGQGYGNSWDVCIEQEFSYNGTGGVTLCFDYINQTEPGYDFSMVFVDTTGSDNDVLVVAYDGFATGSDTLNLIPGTQLPTSSGPITVKFCFTSDGAWSDEDGLYTSGCGAFAVDDILISGGGISHFADFETGSGGWGVSPATPGIGGDWSNIVHLNDLPSPLTPCPCDLQDSVLVFEDLTVGGHGQFQSNIAASPWIDLLSEGLVGTPGKLIEYSYYADMPLLNYLFIQILVQWYPQICPVTGKPITSKFTSLPPYYPSSILACTLLGGEQRYADFSGFMPAAVERVRIAFGVLSFCRIFGNCSGMTNSSPWFDNIKFGVYGPPNAPKIATWITQIPQDAFPEDGTLGISSPGRIDSNDIRGASSPEVGTALGDTLVVRGGYGGSEVYVQFAIHPGPGIDPVRLAQLYDRTTFAETREGLNWYFARMDSAEINGVGATGRTWMTTFHEQAPGFVGSDTDTDTDDLDPQGGQTRLANDIFPDNLLTPGSRLMLFYKTRYVGGTNWFFEPDTTGGNYFEMEVLPSSMASDATFNCVLYVDHFDGLGAQELIENALGNILTGGSNNWENTGWDRWDVRAPYSQQASFGRPLGTEYGATLRQAMGYKTIIWNSGYLTRFNLTKEDADVLIPWLTLPQFGGNNLYLSGDAIVASPISEAVSEPSAAWLVNNIAGVSFQCDTFRDLDCPIGTPQDLTTCVDLDPLTGAVVSTRPLGATPLAEGNHCPSFRSFDIIGPNSSAGYGIPVAEEEYISPIKTGSYASVSNQATGSVTFKTLTDGVSVHFRRDPGQCEFLPGSSPLAVEERLLEALSWFGYTGSPAPCLEPAGVIAVEIDPSPKFRTTLANMTPNPLPMGSSGKIRFTLARRARASVDIFDVAGRLVKTVFDGVGQVGWNEAEWNGKDGSEGRVASGVYFYRLQAEGKTFSSKIVVLR